MQIHHPTSLAIVIFLFVGTASAQFLDQRVGQPQPSLAVKIDTIEAPDLVQARELLKGQQWKGAVAKIRKVLEDEGDQLMLLRQQSTDQTHRYPRYVTARRFCQMMLGSLASSAPNALANYRHQVDPLARGLYRQARDQRDEQLLRRIADDMFVTSLGDDALYRLGEIALEQGNHAMARACWERISSALRTPDTWQPNGQCWWRVLRTADLEERWAELEPVFTTPAISSTWLSYPDTDLNLADVRARLALVSILEGSPQRAAFEIELQRRLHPDAEGRIAGRTGRYADLLKKLLEESKSWKRRSGSSDWPTLGGSQRRSRIAQDIDIVPRPMWQMDLLPVSVEREFIGYGRPRIAESHGGVLSYHPVVVGDLVLWNTSRRILAHRLRDSQPIWDVIGVDPQHRGQEYHWELYPKSGAKSRNEKVAFRPVRGHVGTPRFTMTANGQKLFARLGDPVTGSRDDRAERQRGQRSFIVGLDLSRQARRLPGFPIHPDKDVRWEFEGSPITDGSRLYVAMRYTTQVGSQPELYVACYPLLSIDPPGLDEPRRPLWRVKICNSATPARRDTDEITSCLLSFSEGTVYCNSNMGVVASIAAADGRVNWMVQYPRAPLRPTGPDRRDGHWFRDLNPCVCYKDLVIVAPTDCNRVFALDLASGQLVWEQPLVDVVHLLGVAGGNLVASGNHLYWIDVESGAIAGQYPANGSTSGPKGYGRGILAGDRVYWPTREQIFVFRQRTTKTPMPDGRSLSQPVMARQPIELGAFGAGGGNLIIADGMLLIATANKLFAFGR